MPRNRLPRVTKHYSPTGRRNRGRPLKSLLDTWDRNGSTSGLTQWQIYYDDDDDDIKWEYARRCIIRFNILPSTSRSWQLPFSKIRLFLHLVFCIYICCFYVRDTSQIQTHRPSILASLAVRDLFTSRGLFYSVISTELGRNIFGNTSVL